MKKLPLSGIYITFILFVMYLPILLVIIYSFNENKLTSVWSGFSLRWYGELIRDRSMFEALRNSVILAAISAVLAAVIGTLGAVGMSRAKLRGAAVMEYAATLPIMVPEIILGMVFLAFFSLIRLPFGMTTLVIAHTAFCVPYILLLVKARLAGMDKSYVEAARDLGAGELRAFFDITLPLIVPAVVSGMLLAVAMSMDDVIISVFVTGVNTNTLPIKIYTQIKTGVTPKTNALCTILFLITVIMGGLSSVIGSERKSRVKADKNKEVIN
ncbi:MAG: ABC transporter permease [Clostridiales bacterium]|jgi:spermidine/putrescine transport system permease protein|nr:ABC transporter permease [Clostridiales bacterium]